MNRLALAALVLFASLDAAAATKTYQVTGPVLAIDDQSITVQKGNEKWELARDGSTKIAGDAKVGAKVTVEYRMVATSIETKGAPAADKAPAKKK
ncbi:MAG: hypothetical protein JWM77_4096 [Rhodospirillales bacterium]|jgi:hypothetical protein|nr:hypothetical protein [Rhodospirillales bacterium]